MFTHTINKLYHRITINLFLTTLVINFGKKPDGSKADWSTYLKLGRTPQKKTTDTFGRELTPDPRPIIGIASWFGNCYSGIILTINRNRINLNLRYHQKETTATLGLTKATRYHNDKPLFTQEVLEAKKNHLPLTTKRSIRLSFNWNSEHIATKYGTTQKGDYSKGYPDYTTYKGPLGNHSYI